MPRERVDKIVTKGRKRAVHGTHRKTHQKLPPKHKPPAPTPWNDGGTLANHPSAFRDSAISTAAYFSHPSPQVGQLTIENGLDAANWAYNLNTAVFPTYGGEVVQILSVFINDLTLGGTLSTYSQMEAVYSYFAAYMQIATQGKNPTPQPGRSAYNLDPITFHYPQRGWTFLIYPKSAPGFRLDRETVTPTWRVVTHVIDDSVNLSPIKAAIKESVVATEVQNLKKLNGQISPNSGDPNTNPFQTFTQGRQAGQTALKSDADYYSHLVDAYNQGDFSNLDAGYGSKPSSANKGGGGGSSKPAGSQSQKGNASGKKGGGDPITGIVTGAVNTVSNFTNSFFSEGSPAVGVFNAITGSGGSPGIL